MLDEDSNIKLIDFGLVAEPDVSTVVAVELWMLPGLSLHLDHTGHVRNLLWFPSICSTRYVSRLVMFTARIFL